MASTNVFDRVYEEPKDAVTVRVWNQEGKPVGEASCHPQVSGGEIIAPVLGQLLPVPVALNRAIDIARQFGLLRIVIMLDDETVWNPEWGTLREGRE